MIQGQPLWGMLSSTYEKSLGVHARRLEPLHLPGCLNPKSVGVGLSSFSSIGGNTPGIDFHIQAMQYTYDIHEKSLTKDLVDYTGRSNAAMSVKWQGLTASATETAR